MSVKEISVSYVITIGLPFFESMFLWSMTTGVSMTVSVLTIPFVGAVAMLIAPVTGAAVIRFLTLVFCLDKSAIPIIR